jgi:1-acyl-sn-glycerol-3-phosphate acyltransferase
MQRIICFITLATVKVISLLFYRGEFRWLQPLPQSKWKDVKLFVFLNHTSLYEPLFLQALPFTTLWYLAAHASVPGADITLKRPIVGRFWKLMMPNISSITRKNDSSWSNYLSSIRTDDVILIAPEGRMKRPDGLDKFGKPMSVRGGVVDIIESLDEGKMVLCFSGGLHHVQRPGEHIPRLFKTIKMNLSCHDIQEYKKSFPENSRERKIKMVSDLQERLKRDCPK